MYISPLNIYSGDLSFQKALFAARASFCDERETALTFNAFFRVC